MRRETQNVFGPVHKHPFESQLTFRNAMLTINEFDICYPLLFFSFGYFYHIQPATLPLNFKASISSQTIYPESDSEWVELG